MFFHLVPPFGKDEGLKNLAGHSPAWIGLLDDAFSEAMQVVFLLKGTRRKNEIITPPV